MNKIDPIGLQLFTVRTEMEKDFEDTLKKVAAIGYKEVEFAGYFDHSPKEIRQILDRQGLIAPAAHVTYQNIVSNWQQAVEAAQIIGHTYLVNVIIDPNLLGESNIWHRAAEVFNHAGEISKKAGIQFAYHNHYFEFFPINGKLPYDILLEECDPELVKMEMDFCWAVSVKQDPLAYLQLYPGRFPLVHLKQLKKLPERTPGDEVGPILRDRMLPDLADVGDGIINWKQTLVQSIAAGVRHFFVEHDAPQLPFESVQTSYEYLQNLRF